MTTQPTKKLGDISTFLSGITYKPNQVRSINDGIACFRTKNIQTELDQSDIIYIEESVIKNSEKYLKKGDILVSSANSLELLGKCCLIKDLSYKSTLGGFISGIRPNQDVVDYNYFFYFLRSGFIQGLMRSFANKTTGIANLPMKKVETIEIPLPPLDIQKAIVTKLDEAFAEIDEAISLTEESIAKTEEFKKSVLDKVFEEETDNIEKLGDIITLNYGKGLDKKDRSENGMYPVYGANGVLAMSNNYLIEGDSIIIGRKGSAGALTKINGKFWPTDVTYYVTLNKKGNMEYIYLALQRLNIESLAKGVKPGINRNEVYDLEIPLPPLSKQAEIVKYLDQVFAETSALKSDYETKLTHLKELKASILQSAFEGKLIAE